MMNLEVYIEQGRIAFKASKHFIEITQARKTYLLCRLFVADDVNATAAFSVDAAPAGQFISVLIEPALVTILTDVHATIPCFYTSSCISIRRKCVNYLVMCPGYHTFNLTAGGFTLESTTMYRLTAYPKETLYAELVYAIDSVVLFRQSNPDSKFTLGLSGGVDSAVVLALIVARSPDIELNCKCLAAENSFSEDERFFEALRSTYKAPNITFYLVRISYAQYLARASDMLELLGSPSCCIKNLNLALIVNFLAQDCDYLILGTGPDEYMQGYANMRKCRHVRIQELYLECYRNFCASNAVIITPFLNSRVRSAMLSCQERNKKDLRQIAEQIGIPGAICNRPKRAAQFGSGLSKYLPGDGYDYIDANSVENLKKASQQVIL